MGRVNKINLITDGPSRVDVGPEMEDSLINAMIEPNQLATQESREEDHRGRHTTTWSEILSPIPHIKSENRFSKVP